MARKRKAGDGTVRQRKDGRWEGRIVIGYDDNGYPKTKNVLAKTKKECVEKLQKLKEECGELKPEKVRSEMPFGDWLTYWYENHSKTKIRPTTQETYESRIRLHIIPEIGSIPLNKLTQNDLQQFYGRLKKSGRKRFADKYGEGLSDRMVRMCHATCRSTLEKAVQDGLIRVNPAIGCKLPPKKAREMQVLTREELQRFLIQAIMPGIFSGMFMALTYSLDDFAVTFFVTGNGFSTLSVEIYSRARQGIDLEINALSTVMFLFVLLLVGTYYFITTKKSRRKNHRVIGGLVK